MNYSEKELIMRVRMLDDFNEIPKDYWIIGIRSSEDQTDKFDDTFYLMRGENMVMETTGTTNPGAKVLKGGFRSYNKKGAAVLESDRWYYGVWKPGKHKGVVPALLQTGNKVTVYRDGDGDGKSEEQGYKEHGYFGINFHSASKDFASKLVKTVIAGWSAGCMVCNNLNDYREIINKIKSSNQKEVTFCLLKEFSV